MPLSPCSSGPAPTASGYSARMSRPHLSHVPAWPGPTPSPGGGLGQPSYTGRSWQILSERSALTIPRHGGIATRRPGKLPHGTPDGRGAVGQRRAGSGPSRQL